jgi:hypothetical protein
MRHFSIRDLLSRKMIRLRVTIADLKRVAKDNLRKKTERRRSTWQALLPCFAVER